MNVWVEKTSGEIEIEGGVTIKLSRVTQMKMWPRALPFSPLPPDNKLLTPERSYSHIQHNRYSHIRYEL